MDWGDVGAVAWFLLCIAIWVVGAAAWWGVLGWMEYRDRRSATTRSEAEADLREYGPSALGLRDELLDEPEGRMVLAARSRAGRRRAGRGSAG